MADEYQVKSRAFCNWFQTRRTTISSKIQLADLRHRNAGRGVGVSSFPTQTAELNEDAIVSVRLSRCLVLLSS